MKFIDVDFDNMDIVGLAMIEQMVEHVKQAAIEAGVTFTDDNIVIERRGNDVIVYIEGTNNGE